MDQRSTLIEQLRIDREDEPVTTRPRRWPWWVGSAVLLAGLAAAAWHLLALPQGVPVRVAVAQAASAGTAAGGASILDASGYVVARRRATVSSKITARVEQVLIEEGQHVEEGQIVARLDDSNYRASVAQATAQLEQARANLNLSRVAYENALPTFERHEAQFARSVISAQDLDTARAAYDAARVSVEVSARAVGVAEATLAVAQRNLDDTIIRAPFAGIVTVKAAQEGEMVSPVSAGGGFTRTGIGTVVDMDSLEGEVDVSENFINRVYPGQRVTVRLNAYPDWQIPGSVIAIIPTADRSRATVKVRVRLEERDERVLPEMGLRVAFLNDASGAGSDGTQPASSAVMVPPEAVQASGDTGVVYLLRDNTLERRAVRLGARTQAGQIVLSGLTAGARIAIGDFTELADGVRFRIEN
jgi:RND family efflux transporter MFP subunit